LYNYVFIIIPVYYILIFVNMV